MVNDKKRLKKSAAVGTIRFEYGPNLCRNTRCPCGSGKKFKRCCIKNVKS